MTKKQINLFIMQIAMYFNFHLDDVTLAADFYNDLIMTPSMHLQILLLAEDDFDVTIPLQDGIKLITIQQIIDYIDQKKRD